MKFIIRVLPYTLVFVIFLFSCKTAKISQVEKPALPEVKKNTGTLLYKIEGNGIKPSFLFGTVHVLKQEDFNLKKAVKAALASSDQLVLEVDMDDPNLQKEMMANVQMKDGMTLEKLVDKESYKLLDDKITSLMGVGLKIFNTWQPMILSTLLLSDIVGEAPASFETSLMQLAQENGQEILGLETIKEQLDFFHAMPYKDQAESLLDYIYKAEETADGFNKMTALYLAEDVEGLYSYVKEESKDMNFDMTIFLDKRNMNWLPKIGKLAKEKSSFFGVGAGHLGGPKGLLNLLKKEGYTVSPMKNI